MRSIRIWALSPAYDAKTVKSLPKKLATQLQLGHLPIQASGRAAVPKLNGKGASLSERLRKATHHYLKQDACVIFLIDSDGAMATHQRQQEPNSLIDEIQQVVKEHQFDGKVSLAQTEQELELCLLRKSLEPDAATWREEWDRTLAYFHNVFADTPEDEVIKDFEEALAEVRREQKQT